MAQPELQENTEQMQSTVNSEFPVLDATYGLPTETAKEDMEEKKKGVSANECEYLLENLEDDLTCLDAEIENMEDEEEDGVYEDFVNNPKPVGIKNSLREMYAQYLGEPDKKWHIIKYNRDRLLIERKRILQEKKLEHKQDTLPEESIEQIKSFDRSNFPVLDMTYGLVIKNAKDGMEKIKEGVKESSYLLEDNLFSLESKIKNLEKEKETGFYGDFISDPKIVGIESSLRELYDQYLDESKKRNLTFSLSSIDHPKN